MLQNILREQESNFSEYALKYNADISCKYVRKLMKAQTKILYKRFLGFVL